MKSKSILSDKGRLYSLPFLLLHPCRHKEDRQLKYGITPIGAESKHPDRVYFLICGSVSETRFLYPETAMFPQVKEKGSFAADSLYFCAVSRIQ